MSAKWIKMRLFECIELNPKEPLFKGSIAKKIAMDKLQPFCRDIPNYELAEFTGGTKFRNGDTIMARITPCLENGKTAMVNILNDSEVGFGSTEYIVFRAKDRITTPDFVYYLICSSIVREPAIKSMVGSSGRQRVQTDVVSNLEIELPDIDTQARIGSVLRSLDDKIALNNTINNNLEQQLKTIFHSWFSDNKTSSMTMFALSELCSVITKGTTPTTLGKPFTKNGINFIKAESIMENHFIDKGKFAFIDDETNTMLQRSIIKNGDILFTIAGTLGRFSLIDETILPANTNQAVAIIRADKSKISPYYLYSIFVGNWHNDYYTKRIQQAVQANLSLTTIKSLPIPLLNDEKMNLYLDFIKPLIALIKSNEQENEKLVNLRNSLLPRLMSGELDVSEIEL